MTTMTRWLAPAVLTLGLAGWAGGATPPELINFQGVLRDSAGGPENGSFEMIFRFFDAEVGGNEVFVDEHLLAGAGAVVVTDGLFNVALGSGDTFDGSGPGTFASLSDVFRRLSEVHLEVQVDAEILSPRTRVGSVAYSMGDAPADAPCFDDANRFVDCGNGTITDTVTGLIWLQDASCDAMDGLNGLPGGTYAEANEATARLQDGDCGLTDRSSPGDWRLPTEEEWQAIIDRADANFCSGPFFPDRLGTGCCGSTNCDFTGVVPALYWSESSFDFSPASARMADLYEGRMSGSAKNGWGYVWPVRSAP